MTPPLSLSEIFLSPNLGSAEPQCIIEAFDPMDAMEYGLGLERGWLIDLLSKTSEYSDLIWDNMDSQIYEHLMWSRMALLPEPDVVTKVGNLFRRNFLECSMQERTHFLEVLPFTEYTYTVLPVCVPRQLPLYAKDSDAQPIYEPLTIRSKLHPCFLVGRTAYYGAKQYPHSRIVLDDDTFCHVAGANIDGFGLVPRKWLGEDSPKYDNRPLIFYKQEDPPLSAPPISVVNRFSASTTPQTKGSNGNVTWKKTSASAQKVVPMVPTTHVDVGVGTDPVDET